MTFVGHGIVGATIAVAVMPRDSGIRQKIFTIVAFAVLANLPDAQLPGWGHDRYYFSHSIFVTLVFSSVLAAPFLLSSRLCRKIGGKAVVVGAVLAWYSHLLLDTFYNHGKGIGLFWPFSKWRLALPIPWFETVHGPLPHLDAHSMRVYAIELISYAPVFLIVLFIRTMVRGSRKSPGRLDCG